MRQLEGTEVLLPGSEGQLGILSGHIPLVVTLKPGEVVVKQSGNTVHFAVAGGFAEVINNEVRIMVDSADSAEELDELTIQSAIERAKATMSESIETQQYADAAAQLEANLARLKVVQRRKARGKSTLD
ncbi:MAG: ATP synthase F1 subunit epsilon [Methanothrix sp.]